MIRIQHIQETESVELQWCEPCKVWHANNDHVLCVAEIPEVIPQDTEAMKDGKFD